MHGTVALPAFDFQQRTRLIYGPGTLESQLVSAVRELSCGTALLVTDAGLRQAGHATRAEKLLLDAGLQCHVYDDVHENPTSDDVDACTSFAKARGADVLIGLGGGSSMDCAKGANFLLTNGGRIHDYKGVGRARLPMLPMIAVPTTSGTGSEAQSFAVIADAESHLKMACGDVKAACRVAILDPLLTLTMPESVTAATGIDAMTHAIESFVTVRRNAISGMFAGQAWELLSGAFPRVLAAPADVDARGCMQLGAFLAGAAIENSMLGAAHATANPLTAQFGTTHGHAVGLMMPHVIRCNAELAPIAQLYAQLVQRAGWSDAGGVADAAGAGERLASGFVDLLKLAGLPTTLPEAAGEVPNSELIWRLATDAAQQWTGTFNPRRLEAADFAALYTKALL
ncbi:MAG: iron-containing alcohol dehydrogenase [Planctomycetaceae bacterium]